MLKKLYMMILVISLIVVGMVALDRSKIESRHKTVEMVLDYDEAVLLAEQSEHDLGWWFAHFKSIGFTSVAVKESTLENLKAEHEPLEYWVVSDLLKDTSWENSVSEEAASQIRQSSDRFDLVVTTPSDSLYQFILGGLAERYPEDFYEAYPGDINTIVLDGTPQDGLYAEMGFLVDEDGKNKRTLRELKDSKLAWIGLGFRPEMIAEVKESGLEVLPRPSNNERHPERVVEAFKIEMERFDIEPSYFVFQGESVLGYDSETGNMDDLYTYMHDEGISAGLIESGVQRAHVKQDGLEDLTEMLDYDGIRVFPVVGYIQERYKWYGYEGAEEIENTIYRAVTERNIRSIYFRPFREMDNEVVYITDPEIYTVSMERLASRLLEHGIEFGPASKMDFNNPGPIKLTVIGYGLAVLAIIALNSLVPLTDKLQAMLLSFGVLGVTAANFVAPNMAATLMALGASILFPVIAAIVMMDILKQYLIHRQIDRMGTILWKSVLLLLTVSAIAMVGGIFVGSILSSSPYLLETKYFRGVKISQIAPIAAFCLVYILRFGYGRPVSDIDEDHTYFIDLKNLLNERIKVLHLLVLGAVAAIGVVYIARTGHETVIQPSDFEMLFRNFLEYNFIARPRTKEMLLGFPVVIIAAYGALKGWKSFVFPFAALAMVGLTSVVNTFSHLRAPLYLSIARTIYGLGFGAVLGIISMMVLEAGLRLAAKVRGRHGHE